MPGEDAAFAEPPPRHCRAAKPRLRRRRSQPALHIGAPRGGVEVDLPRDRGDHAGSPGGHGRLVGAGELGELRVGEPLAQREVEQGALRRHELGEGFHQLRTGFCRFRVRYDHAADEVISALRPRVGRHRGGAGGACARLGRLPGAVHSRCPDARHGNAQCGWCVGRHRGLRRGVALRDGSVRQGAPLGHPERQAGPRGEQGASARGRYTVVALAGSPPELRAYRDDSAAPNIARLRVIHAAPELGKPDLTLDGKVVAKQVPSRRPPPTGGCLPEITRSR